MGDYLPVSRYLNPRARRWRAVPPCIRGPVARAAAVDTARCVPQPAPSHDPPVAPAASAVVDRAGRRVAVRDAKRLRARVDLRGLPAARSACASSAVIATGGACARCGPTAHAWRRDEPAAAGRALARARRRALSGAATPAAAAPVDRVCADEFILGGTYHDVTVKSGAWCLLGDAQVTGDFRATGATSVGIFMDTTIAGDVRISGTTSNPDATGETFGGSANGICTTTIGGDLTIEHSGPAAPWNVGSTNYPPS